MGTDKESFIELTERIGRKTGGISVYPFSSAKRGSDTPVSYIMVRGRQHRAVQSAGQGSTCSLQCSSQPYTVLYCTVYSGALQQSAVQACVAGLRVACVPGNTSGKTGNPPRPLHVSHTYSPLPPPPPSLTHQKIRGKSMGHNSGDLFELMGDILATARLDDKARFGQMVAETKANMEAGIVGSGHR